MERPLDENEFPEIEMTDTRQKKEEVEEPVCNLDDGECLSCGS